MSIQKNKPEQIVTVLRQIEVAVLGGKAPPLSASKEWEKRLRFGRTRPLPSRRCRRHWRNGV